MFNLIKKDFLTISRDRSELLILLAMPLILIAILSFALGGIMSGEEGNIDKIPLALVIENDFEEDLESFHQELVEEGIPEEAMEQVLVGAQQADPAILFLDLLRELDRNGLIELKEIYNRQGAQEAIKNEDVFAVITIPENFSYNTIRAVFLDKYSEATIEVLVPDSEHLYSGIIDSIVTNFTEQYNLEVSISQMTQGKAVDSQLDDKLGGIIHLDAARPVSSFQYYTVGMAVMFGLYVASTISSNAFKEKKDHVFARLMITGQSPVSYLLSKGISATAISIVQLLILFTVSTVAFQTFSDLGPESLGGLALVTLIFSLTIGALAILLTAVALQFNSDAVSGFFSGFIVTILAFVGGSYLPVDQISPLLKELGNWTPNGATMTSYLQLIQGFGISGILPLIYRVGIMFIIIIGLGIAIFPKRRLI